MTTKRLLDQQAKRTKKLKELAARYKKANSELDG